MDHKCDGVLLNLLVYVTGEQLLATLWCICLAWVR